MPEGARPEERGGATHRITRSPVNGSLHPQGGSSCIPPAGTVAPLRNVFHCRASMLSPPSENSRTLTGTGRIVVVTLGLLVVGGGIMNAAIKFGKKAGEAPVKRPVPDVELITAAVENVPLTIASQGVIQAVVETRAAAEVPGKVIRVSPSWDTGGSFQAGDELLAMDDADFRAALANAEAAAAEAALQVRMEEERAAQALRDWSKLAGGKPDSDLVTREPQLAAAKARSTAAAAAVEKARRDLERTVLRAPYAGRIRATLTDLGSYAAPGAPLAEFYGTDAYQVSLPLSLDDYAMLDVQPGAAVTLTAAGIPPVQATLLRPGGEIDRASRTIAVIAGIKAESADKPLPPLVVPGLFVQASLRGITLQNVVRLPRVCLLSENRAAVVTAENRLSFRTVKVARFGRDEVYISEGLKAGDRVLATALAVATEGMEVNPLTPAAAPVPPAPASAPAGKSL